MSGPATAYRILLAEKADGTEYTVGALIGDMAMPLVLNEGSSEFARMMIIMRETGRRHQKKTGERVRIVKFVRTDDVEEIT